MKVRLALAHVAFALSILAAPLAAEGQQAAKIPRVGYVAPGTFSVSSPPFEVFRLGLRDLGYVEGQTVALEARWAEGKPERLPNLVAELIRLKVDLMVVVGTATALAAKRATSTIPTVFVNADDPVGAGLVTSLSRPGGNLTGLAGIGGGLIGKRLELLKEGLPRATRVAVLGEPAHRFHAADVSEARAAARTLGVQLQVLELRGPDDLEAAFAAMTRERADALLVLSSPLTFVLAKPIIDLAGKNRLPVMYAYRHQAEDGALIAYGPSFRDMFRRAASLVDKILKGAKPADLPVEQPTKFELVINLKTAKALALTIPPSVLLRADQVIE